MSNKLELAAQQALCWRKLLPAALVVVALGLGGLGFPVVVEDDRGLEIEIAAPPTRVVVLAALYGEIVLGLEAADQVVGVADTPDNPEALRDLPSVGPPFAPSIESILALTPDLVLGGWGDVRSGLERAGIPVLTAGQEGGFIAGVPDIFAAVRAVGRALGRSETAARLVGDIAAQIVEIESKVLGSPEVRVAFLYLHAPDSSPYALGRGTIEHELMLRAGGVNVFADVDGFPQVSLEEVLARDPQVIFTDPTQVEHFAGSRKLGEVAAVRDGRVYPVRAAETASTRVAHALRAMASRLHPEAFERD